MLIVLCRRWLWGAGLVCCVVLGMAGILWAGHRVEDAPAFAAQGETMVTVIVDPGHGGVDGGASTADGVLERDLNLEVAQRVRDLLCLTGQRAVLTRTTEEDLHTEGDTIRERKVSDIRNRVALVNGTENGLLLSIHQNNFTDGRYSGAQVFYAGTEGSAQLAKLLQEQLVSALNPGSNRKCKKSDGVYLMEHIDCTGVLIECGFLSNVEEEAKLSCGTYQKKLCCVIAATVSQYLSNT